MHPLLAPAAALPSVSNALQASPWSLHALMLLALVGGVVLWLVGRQVLRPTTIFLSAVSGAILGFVLWPVFAGESGVSPYVGMAVGLALGLLLGFALYRVTTAAAFGGMVAAAFSLLTATGFHLASNPPRLHAATSLALQEPAEPGDLPAPPGSGLGGGDEQPVVLPPDMPDEPPLIDPDVPTPPPPARKRPSATPAPAPGTPGATKPSAKAPSVSTPARPSAAKPNTPSAREQAQTPRDPLATDRPDAPELSSTAARARDVAVAIRAAAADRWQSTPAGERLWIMCAGVVGAGLGILLGILMPAWAAATVTSFTGSAVALPSAAWLMVATNLPGQSMLNLSPLGWTVVWVSVAVLGLVIQTQGLINVSEKPAKGKRKKAARKAEAE